MPECRSCRAPVTWARTTSGKAMPVEPALPGLGNVVLEDEDGGQLARVVGTGEGTHVAHFAVCPEAKEWRRRDG